MAGRWQLQEAKNKFSQVVEEAIQEGPQIITRHGKEVVVVLSMLEFRRLASSQEKLTDFFQKSPLAEVDLDLSRDRLPIREDQIL